MIDDIINWNILTNSPKDPELYMTLVIEEFKEFEGSIWDKRDSEEGSTDWQSTHGDTAVLDALGDMVWVCIGMMRAMGYDPHKVMKIIADSNYSKFCVNEDEAKASVAEYAKKGVQATYRKVGSLYIMYRMEDDKILKGINYKEPDWSELNDH